MTTKLVEWLAGIVAFLSVWYYVVSNDHIPPSWEFHAWLVPVYVVLLFGLVSAVIVLYRVFTFRDCPEAAEELKREIEKAKEELKIRGILAW